MKKGKLIGKWTDWNKKEERGTEYTVRKCNKTHNKHTTQNEDELTFENPLPWISENKGEGEIIVDRVTRHMLSVRYQ